MQLQLNIPDQYLLNVSPEELTARFKLYTALLMYQEGQLSSGAACEFAGVDRFAFLTACKRHHINTMDYDPDELTADFGTLTTNKLSPTC